MQEISPNVYIDTAYAGVTLGAISWTHGLILIDAPLRAEDVRLWRSALLNLGGGIERLLINHDAHYDRTLGTRAMDSTVVAHERVAQAIRNRPMTFKVQGAETGAEWELINGLGSVRWAPPDITFSQRMAIQWDASLMLLEHRPGPSGGAIWVELPARKVVFVGDAVVVDQPPFLARADLPAWIETLNLLLSPAYNGYTIVSSRGGVVVPAQARQMLRMLEKTASALDKLSEKGAPPEQTFKLVDGLMPSETGNPMLVEHHRQRLRWGLSQYYTRHNRLEPADVDD